MFKFGQMYLLTSKPTLNIIWVLFGVSEREGLEVKGLVSKAPVSAWGTLESLYRYINHLNKRLTDNRSTNGCAGSGPVNHV